MSGPVPAADPVERIARVAPLGLRFRDDATGAIVGDGLSVRATRDGGHRATAAGPPHGTVYALRDLPGLRDVEQPPAPEEGDVGDDAWWAAHPPATRFVLDVDDREGRYLPFTFTLLLPRRGLVVDACGDGATGGVPLYSAPARTAPLGMGLVTADVWDLTNDAPAAWAVLDVLERGNRLARGVADGRGTVVAPFHWPAPTQTLDTAPPLHEQRWEVTVELRYAPPAAGEEPPDRAPLCDLLGQPRAALRRGPTGTAPFEPPRLQYGRELRLASRDSAQARLLCRPNP